MRTQGNLSRRGALLLVNKAPISATSSLCGPVFAQEKASVRGKEKKKKLAREIFSFKKNVRVCVGNNVSTQVKQPEGDSFK